MMKIVKRKLRFGFITLTGITVITTAAILGGIEWAFAALGAFVIAGTGALCFYVLFKAYRYSRLPLKDVTLENIYFPGKTVKVKPVNIWDKRVILRHINDLFTTEGEEVTGTNPVTKKDKKLIMREIDSIFGAEYEKNAKRAGKPAPITLKDKKMIMSNIEELFTIDTEHSEEMSW
jgi:hypothetical protein